MRVEIQTTYRKGRLHLAAHDETGRPLHDKAGEPIAVSVDLSQGVEPGHVERVTEALKARAESIVARPPGAVVIGPIRATVMPRRPRDDEGRWYWRARRTVDGTRVMVWSGHAHPGELPAILGPLLAGIEPARKTRTEDTVGHVLACYDAAVQRDAGIRASSKAMTRTVLRRLLERLGEDTVMSRLRPHDLETLRDRAIREGYATATVKMWLKRLRAAWKWAYLHELIDVEWPGMPTLKVRPKRSKETPERAYLWRIYDAIEAYARLNGGANPLTWAPDYYRILLSTGMRPGECDALTWADVRETAAPPCIMVSEDGKTGARAVVIDYDTAERLAEMRPEGGGPLWPVVRGSRSLSRVLREHLDWSAIGCAPVTLYALRRAAARALYEAGASPAVEAAQLGHSPKVALQHYVEPRNADRQRAAEVAGLGRRGEAKVVDIRSRRKGEG